MSGEQAVTLPEPPSANRYWRTTVARTRFGRAYVKTYRSRAADEYRQLAFNAWCAAHGYQLASEPIGIEIHWRPRRRSGDLDNRIKVLLDALQGAAYRDDRQVVALHAYREADGELVPGTVRVAIYRISPA